VEALHADPAARCDDPVGRGGSRAISPRDGVLDLLGGIGILLPAVTRIAPALTVLAALGCTALQVGAIVFHLSRGEAADTPFNVLLAALALFVAWGRRSKAPIAARRG
jgi:hypothetical protein